MSTGHGSDLPDYSGGYGSGSAGDPYGSSASHGREYDPYSQSEFAQQDPYAVGDDGRDPYATDPLEADGFGPSFGSSSSSGEGSPGGYTTAPPPYPAQSVQPYGAPPSGPQGYYPPAGPQGYYPPALPSSRAAVTGFVLGLLALTLCAGLTAPVGIFFSAKGMKDTAPGATEPQGGRGLAIAGLVTNLIGLLPFVIMMLYFFGFIFLIASEFATV